MPLYDYSTQTLKKHVGKISPYNFTKQKFSSFHCTIPLTWHQLHIGSMMHESILYSAGGLLTQLNKYKMFIVYRKEHMCDWNCKRNLYTSNINIRMCDTGWPLQLWSLATRLPNMYSLRHQHEIPTVTGQLNNQYFAAYRKWKVYTEP